MSSAPDPDATFATYPEEVKALAVSLCEVVAQTSSESRWHLEMALGARRFGGVTGDLVVRVPRRQNEHAVIKWVGGGLIAI